jgi:hypothetical protein
MLEPQEGPREIQVASATPPSTDFSDVSFGALDLFADDAFDEQAAPPKPWYRRPGVLADTVRPITSVSMSAQVPQRPGNATERRRAVLSRGRGCASTPLRCEY